MLHIALKISVILLCQISFAAAEFDARNLPANEKILFFLGQNSDAIGEYKKNVIDHNSQAVLPGGITLYTTLSLVDDDKYQELDRGVPLQSLIGSDNWGDGEHNLKRSMNDYPYAALSIGLDLSDHRDANVDPCACEHRPLTYIAALENTKFDLDADTVKKYGAAVDRLIQILKATERPVYLRIGYEFDGPWNCYSPEAFKSTFRYIKKRIDHFEAKNIATVWQTALSAIDGEKYYAVSKKGHFNRWYPGDEFVDWMGMSTFLVKESLKHQAPNLLTRWWFMNDIVKNQARFLNFARVHNKPVFIAEAAPKGYDLTNLTASLSYIRKDTSVTVEELWDSWFAGWFKMIEENRDVIRAVAYINYNWASSPMWRCDEDSQFWPGESVPVDADHPQAPACPIGTPWGDTRVQANYLILRNFEQELRKAHFVQVSQ